MKELLSRRNMLSQTDQVGRYNLPAHEPSLADAANKFPALQEKACSRFYQKVALSRKTQ